MNRDNDDDAGELYEADETEELHPAVEELKLQFARLTRKRLEIEESDASEAERRAAIEEVLKEQMRAAFLTHTMATAGDFERLWPRLRDDLLCEHATNVYFQVIDYLAEEPDEDF